VNIDGFEKYMVVFLIGIFIPMIVYIKCKEFDKVENAVELTSSEVVKLTDKSTITTTKKKKDGSTTIVVEQRDVQKTEQKEVVLYKESKQSRYSVSGGVKTHVASFTDATDYYINLGVRAVGPLWLESGYQINDKQLSVGVRYEF